MFTVTRQKNSAFELNKIPCKRRRITIGKKSNLNHQFQAELKKETRFGESKHKAKEAAKREAEEKQEAYKQVRGIFSHKTFADYKESLSIYTNWVIKHHSEVKNIAQAKKYIPEYMEELRERGLSEWSIHKYAYAFRSCYHCEISDLGITLGVRSRADVIRDRDAGDNALRNRERYSQTVMVLKATGCRRMELLRLRREDFRENGDGTLSVFKRGKNGMERWCLVNPNYSGEIRRFLAEKETSYTGKENRLFAKADIPRNLPVHDLRADYACDLYRYFESRGFASGEMYHCRKELKGCHYDKGILKEVSYNLQHGRNNVVIDYLWKM